MMTATRGAVKRNAVW